MRLSARLLLLGAGFAASAATVATPPAPANLGPYNARFLEGGIGIARPLDAALPQLGARAELTLAAFVRIERVQSGAVTLIALGDPAGVCRCLDLDGGRPVFRDGGAVISALAPLPAGRFVHVAAVRRADGTVLYVDGKRVAAGRAGTAAVAPAIAIAPPLGTWPDARHFGGTLVGAAVRAGAPAPADIAAEAASPPDFRTVQLWNVGQGWEWQKKANTGLWRPQDPWTLPRGNAAPRPPVARPAPALPPLEAVGGGRFRVNGWRMAEAPGVKADAARLSLPGFDASAWHAATVPGTALTTLVDRGVWPDPYYGLDNLAIPESLARQDYWYRTTIAVPAALRDRRLLLRLNGVNYASEVWVNGARLGTTRGAFARGEFALPPGAAEYAVAVRVSPPPHPGTPHEQSIAGGVGENGGQLAIDGPTFVATEGWDWIPAIRDRNTGLWQDVELEATGPVRIGDPHVVTDLPLPRTDSADIRIEVPLVNLDQRPLAVTVTAAFEGVRVSQTVTAPPGASSVRFSPDRFPALRVQKPRLWWPNGYGEPALYALTLTASAGPEVSDTAELRFGVREISYELSLFDRAGSLRRVDVHLTDAAPGERLVDVRHAAIKETPRGWAASLTPAGEASPAVRAVPETFALPHLALRVNGQRIAVRGGNWGMDDAMKRSGRERLEPYFRLQRDAHMNIIRNWMGNSNQPSFFDLADEYGMLVLNDFWQSTQDFQVEPQDPQLFLANARDTVSRYRNHPSIALWFGRNEGVPYPLLNEGLDDVVAALDGTRLFLGSSNVVNLQGSGPYNYRPPEGYFTDLASGFSVETGTPSLATLEAIRAMVPAAYQWPLSDSLAYHDWHFAGNGDTRTFMAALETMFGPATSLEDFERKAQMMNLETHKAMFEGFLGHLWTKNSGRLLWMSHPAWPSNAWQLYSSDYDTHAAYYGAKAATEPLHIQLNSPENRVVIVNTRLEAAAGLTARARLFDLQGLETLKVERRADAAANAVTPLAMPEVAAALAAAPLSLVRLELIGPDGAVRSLNDYWRARTAADNRALTGLPAQPVALAVTGGDPRSLRVTLTNRGAAPATGVKLTVVDNAGARVLPAYYADNYLTLLPGESRDVAIEVPASQGAAAAVEVRGWNVVPARAAVTR